MTVLRKNTIATATSDDPLLFVMSDSTKDRHGDVVEASGIDRTEFNKNSIALANHDSHYVIGTWVDVHVEGTKLLGRLKMAAMGTSARIDELRRLVYAGILKACSIGFIPLETSPLPGGGVRYVRSQLLECSIVATPSNPNALRAEAKALGTSEATIKTLIDRPPLNGSLAQRQEHAARSRTATTYSPAERARIRASVARFDAESAARTSELEQRCLLVEALREEVKFLTPLAAYRYSFEHHDRHFKAQRELEKAERALRTELRRQGLD